MTDDADFDVVARDETGEGEFVRVEDGSTRTVLDFVASGDTGERQRSAVDVSGGACLRADVVVVDIGSAEKVCERHGFAIGRIPVGELTCG